MNIDRILVVDDEPKMRKLIKDFLSIKGYEVIEAENGNKALEIFRSDKNISLIVLDIMMPEINGMDVLKTIRKSSSIPVIMLTAKSLEEDEISGLESGADDYITKPFSPKLLVVRVENILKRNKKVNDSNKLSYAGIIVDKSGHTVTVDDKITELSYKEFELLCFLIENKGIALSRERILNGVWDYDYYGDARTVDTHIKKLRAKLGDKGECIKTIWGMGYKFE